MSTPSPLLTLLSSPPPALTPAELATISANTPVSFEGIAPLLRYKGTVEISVEPAFEGFNGGKGELFVTEGAVSFFSPLTSTGISIPYPLITLHAISRAALRPPPSTSEANGSTETEGGPCIYCQVDESEEMDDEQGAGETREVVIVPVESSALDTIFETLSTCASLHPPPTTSSSSPFFGLDPDSTVYADVDVDGGLAGPGLEGIEVMTEEDERELEGLQSGNGGTGGRVRSSFVGDTRRGPY